MRNDDRNLRNRIAERLVTVQMRFGDPVYRDAAQRALAGIARAALAEAERRASRQVPKCTEQDRYQQGQIDQ